MSVSLPVPAATAAPAAGQSKPPSYAGCGPHPGADGGSSVCDVSSLNLAAGTVCEGTAGGTFLTEAVAHDIALVVTEPPSANRVWRKMRGRMIKAGNYEDWLETQGSRIAEQLGGDGIPHWFSVTFLVGPTRKDLDNLCKPLCDLLQKSGAIKNDRYLRRMFMRADDSREPGTVAIFLNAVAGPAPKPKARRKRA